MINNNCIHLAVGVDIFYGRCLSDISYHVICQIPHVPFGADGKTCPYYEPKISEFEEIVKSAAKKYESESCKQ